MCLKSNKLRVIAGGSKTNDRDKKKEQQKEKRFLERREGHKVEEGRTREYEKKEI